MNLPSEVTKGITNPGTKSFVLFSAGTRLSDHVTNGIQPWLNVEAEYLDYKMKCVLEGMAWLDPKVYMPFLENAQVGDMIVLKEMIGVVRLRYPVNDDDSAVWERLNG